ncbi:MAG: allophanate hydrolase [Bradyrhizobiaceae bacterium]|nr:MAG: allophanate hydrolase [Bradyrhizobiaceae bacterium]
MIETVAEIVSAHRSGKVSPRDTVARSFARIREYDDPAVFISLRDEAEAIAEAEALSSKEGAAQLPLFGVPVAVKDNIDVAGLPTTAACPAFSYMPAQDAVSVRRLRAAGAIVIGKTNLDQFATGLVGVRSPYGIPRNPIRADLIPGGSSSGSAVAVAAGLVPLSLGTDTAGSGRVPAMLNNIVGLKPSLGLISTSGVLPACRTLDCVSIFSLNVDDAVIALQAMAAFDETDPYSRRRPFGAVGGLPQGLRLGVPRAGQLKFYGDTKAAEGYDAALKRFIALGAKPVEFDIEPFYELALLLYNGPWVAERYLVIRDLLKKDPDAVHPVTRDITLKGEPMTAADAFAAFYKLQAMRRVSENVFAQFDAMLLPTAPSAYTVDEVLENPVELNSRNGTYTNFVNFLDLSALALPVSMRSDGIPFGITLVGKGGDDALLASIGRVFHAGSNLAAGALKVPVPSPAAPSPFVKEGEVALAVVGAHLSGMTLNSELRELGGRLLEVTDTAPDYRLYALNGTVPPKPGLLRVGEGKGASIAVETWALSTEAFGAFVEGIPSPLSIGTVRLAGGATVKGFLVEALAVEGSHDISHFGGWRAYMEAQAKTA